MGPQGCARTVLNGPVGFQDGPKIVVVRSFFRLVVWDRFFGRFGVVFGRSGGRFGAFSAVQLIDSTRQLIDSSIQRINSLTYHPMALRHFLTRPGGLRASRLNNKNIHVCV